MRGDIWRVMCQKIVPLIVTTHINHHVRQTYVFNDSSLLPKLINGHQEFDVGLAPYPALRRQWFLIRSRPITAGDLGAPICVHYYVYHVFVTWSNAEATDHNGRICRLLAWIYWMTAKLKPSCIAFTLWCETGPVFFNSSTTLTSLITMVTPDSSSSLIHGCDSWETIIGTIIIIFFGY